MEVTEEELASIKRIAAMGFPETAALEAFLVTGKNEEMAVNYLFENPSMVEEHRLASNQMENTGTDQQQVQNQTNNTDQNLQQNNNLNQQPDQTNVENTDNTSMNDANNQGDPNNNQQDPNNNQEDPNDMGDGGNKQE